MKVLFIGENIYNSRSGVVTVMKQILESDELRKHVKYKEIFTTGDEYSIFKKLKGWGKAYIIFLYSLPKCNIVHIHHAISINFWLTAVMLYIAKALNKKVILHNHAADFHIFYSKCSERKKQKIREIFTLADMNIVLSTSWMKWYRSITPEAKWVLLPNSITMPNNYITKKIYDKEINLIYLARIEERKGIYNLMNIMPNVIKEYSNCKLYIAGQGDTDRIKESIKKNKLNKNVIILGHINSQEKDALLRKGHLFILPSFNEGLPMSLLEAMSYGLVPITSSVGGIPDVVGSGENGILIEPGNEMEILEGIRYMLTNKDLYSNMSSQARQRVSKDFNLNVYTKKLLSIYLSLNEKVIQR